MSGDCNPMQMDALAARQTMAGFPVVHGIHSLLWCLYCLFRTLSLGLTVAPVKASFEKMIYLIAVTGVVKSLHPPAPNAYEPGATSHRVPC